jgi:hypothetical protein
MKKEAVKTSLKMDGVILAILIYQLNSIGLHMQNEYHFKSEDCRKIKTVERKNTLEHEYTMLAKMT